MSKYIFLSYLLSENDPLYRNEGTRPEFSVLKSLSKGDNANITKMIITSHSGTHIDFPRHFFNKGKCGDNYKPEDFIFNNILVIELNKKNGLINKDDFKVLKPDNNTEILLIKTGSCYKRNKIDYWKKYPGISSESPEILKRNYPNLKAIGIDQISISSYENRAEGLVTHREFLKREIWIIEDMDLRKINKNTKFKKIFISPILFKKCDGGISNIIAEIE